MERNLEPVGAICKSLVHGVVDHLVDEVMEAAGPRRADVHTRSQPNGLETLENGDVLCRVRCFSQ